MLPSAVNKMTYNLREFFNGSHFFILGTHNIFVTISVFNK